MGSFIALFWIIFELFFVGFGFLICFVEVLSDFSHALGRKFF